MTFQCFGDMSDVDPYFSNLPKFDNPYDEISYLKQQLRDKTNLGTKLRLVNDQLRRKYQIIKTKNKDLKERAESSTSIQQQHESDLQKLAHQTRAKIQELHNENQHVQECYNALKHKQSTHQDTVTSLRDEISRLQTVISRKDETIKALHPYREQTKTYIVKMNELTDVYKKNEKCYQDNISLLKRASVHQVAQLKSNKSQLSILQNELTTAQQSPRTLMDANLPTIQQTLSMYKDMKDQTYTKTIHVLRVYLRNTYDETYHELYVNQICHEIMFNVLIACYNAVKVYKITLFDQLSAILNIKSGQKEQTDVNDDAKSMEMERQYMDSVLNDVLGSYFKRNYANILNVEQVTQSVVDNIKDDVIKPSHGGIVQNVFELERDSEEMAQMMEYIEQCCSVCWVMRLQEPVLKLYPSFWRLGIVNNNVFDGNVHERVLGSDLECQDVLYHVWPLIIQNNDIIGNQKIEIVTGQKLYQQNKQNGKNK